MQNIELHFTRMVKELPTCTTDGYYEYYYCTGCTDIVRTPIYRTYNHRFTEMHGTAIIDGKEDFYSAIRCRDCMIEAAHRSFNYTGKSNINYYISGSPYYTGKYNPQGELVIYGEGALPSYFIKNTDGKTILPPWYEHSADYDLVRIGDYITEISANAFKGSCPYVNTVSIGRSVEIIKTNAFGDATGIKTLYLPKSLKTIEANAFAHITAPVIRYEGSKEDFEKMSKTVMEIIDHTIQLEEKFLPKFSVETSQYSLLKNRIQSLYTARKLISGEEAPTREELEFSLPRIESIIHKMGKARDKYEPGSRNYKRFDLTVRAIEEVKAAILRSLEV